MDSADKAVSESTAASAEKTNENQITTEPNSAANLKSSNNTSHSHMSAAQNIFSGRPNAGLMCNNLRANPFSVSDNSSNSSGILAKPKFSLKPSSFGNSDPSSGTGDQNQEVTAGATSNPFLRPAKLNYDNDEDSNDAKQNTEKSTDSSAEKSANISDNAKETTSKSPETTETANANVSSTSEAASSTLQETMLAAAATTFGSTTVLRAPQSSFVFGEALDSRVTNATKENGTNGHSDSEESQKPKTLTLEEAADEYKKQQESGPILPEVETFTGEEEESNVLQISCKLFLFHDKDKTWAERGRGCLRLNDDPEGLHSRIVMRTAGIHRVILNTNIWPAMICERANLKSIRITGTECDQVHVYLITGSPADIDHLHNAVTYRIQRLKQQSSSTAPTTTSPAVEPGASSAAAKLTSSPTPAAVSSTTEHTEDADATAKRKAQETDETTPKRAKVDTNEAE